MTVHSATPLSPKQPSAYERPFAQVNVPLLQATMLVMDAFLEQQWKRAVDIADGCCRSDVELLGIELEGRAGCYLPTDALGFPVGTLASASLTLRKAYAWLRDRGLANLCVHQGRHCIELRPFPVAAPDPSPRSRPRRVPVPRTTVRSAVR